MLCKRQKTIVAAFLGLVLLLAASCKRTDSEMAQYGVLMLSIDEITLSDKGVQLRTKAPALDEYTITITDQEGQSVYSAPYLATPIVLPDGQYTITAVAGSIQPLAFDAPAYGGSIDATIEIAKTNKCTITSKLANAIIAQPTYDPLLTAHLTDYHTQVTSGNVTETLTPDESRTLYVQSAQECTVNLVGINDLGKSVTRHITTFSPVAATRYNATLNLSPAQFSIPAQNAALAWSYEFTVTPITESNFIKGNYASYADHITYEYSLNGVDNWSQVPKVGNDFRCTGLAANTTYHLRARADMPGNLVVFSTNIETITTENPTQVPNSGFDTWYTQNIFNGAGGVWNASIDAYHPSSQEEFNSNTERWTTSNGRSTIKDYSSQSTHYKSNSGVKNNGGAAEITTIGLKSSIERKNRTDWRVIGELALGTLNSEKYIDHGMAFSARPTAMKFSHKYAPHNGDAAQIEIKLWGMVDGILTAIGSGSLSQASSIPNFTDATIDIDYQRTDIPATEITISFRSGHRDESDAVYESRGSYGISPWKYDQFLGSRLTIDNVELIYNK